MTPHIEAKKDEIAKTVIMPGDSLRAKMITETYLKDYKLVNTVRNTLAYTGYYKDTLVTVMASGMGIPSAGIYSYELYDVYEVENIIRVGSAGSYIKDLDLYDLVLVNGSYSESSYAKTQNGCLDNILYASDSLNSSLQESANELGYHLTIGNIHSSDVFYRSENNYKDLYDKYGCLAVEMESFAIFHNANVLNKRGACLLTISDNFVTDAITTSEERQNSFTKMVEVALLTATKL